MKIDQYIKMLSTCDLFTNIDKDELLKIFDSINYRIIKYAKNTIIHKKNDSCKDLIIILNGTLSLYEDNFNNKTFTVYSFSPVSIVGANTLFSDNNHYKLNIICKTNCTLLYISRDVIFNLFNKNDIVLRNYLNHMSKKSQILLDKISTLSNKSLRLSIASYLNYEYAKQRSHKILLNMTKTELATHFGVERTSLSRELQSMKKDNLIDYDRHSITILDSNFFNIK